MKAELNASPRTNLYLCASAGAVGRRRGLSYSVNCRVEVTGDGGAVMGVKIPRIKNPSVKVLLVDESDLTLNDGNFAPAGDENKRPELHLRHSGGGNVAFCDGHIMWIERKGFLQMMRPESQASWFLPSQ